jgi:hypothetical protein
MLVVEKGQMIFSSVFSEQSMRLERAQAFYCLRRKKKRRGIQNKQLLQRLNGVPDCNCALGFGRISVCLQV